MVLVDVYDVLILVWVYKLVFSYDKVKVIIVEGSGYYFDFVVVEVFFVVEEKFVVIVVYFKDVV